MDGFKTQPQPQPKIEASRRYGGLQSWPALPYRSFVHEELLHGCCTQKRLPAAKSQVNGTERPSRHDRAKINQRTSLTSHNEPSCWSQAFFGLPQLTQDTPTHRCLLHGYCTPAASEGHRPDLHSSGHHLVRLSC